MQTQSSSLELPAPILAIILEGTDIYRLGSYRRVCRNWRNAIDGYITPIVLRRFPHMAPYHSDHNPWWMAAEHWATLRIQAKVFQVIQEGPTLEYTSCYVTAINWAGWDRVWIALRTKLGRSVASIVERDLCAQKVLHRIELGPAGECDVSQFVQLDLTIICWRTNGTLNVVSGDHILYTMPVAMNSNVVDGVIARLPDRGKTVQLFRLGTTIQQMGTISLIEPERKKDPWRVSLFLSSKFIFVEWANHTAGGFRNIVDIYHRDTEQRIRRWSSHSPHKLVPLRAGLFSYPSSGGVVTFHSTQTGMPSTTRLCEDKGCYVNLCEKAGYLFVGLKGKGGSEEARTLVFDRSFRFVDQFEHCGLIACDGVRIASAQNWRFGFKVCLWRFSPNGLEKTGEICRDRRRIRSLTLTSTDLVLGLGHTDGFGHYIKDQILLLRLVYVR